MRDELAAHARWMEQRTSSWLEPADLASGVSGRFDALDLRAWLSLAAAAEVPAIPARTIALLTEGEMSALSGAVELRIAEATQGRLQEAIGKLDAQGKIAFAAMLASDEPSSREAVAERLYAAMDEVPEGWMVRHARCAASSVKALAAHGMAGVSSPETRFGPDLEVGPGWVRNGNRRRIDVSDRRILEGAVGAKGGLSAFVARPWVRTSRLLVQDDPHRADTPYAGKGMWPAEWRVFVEAGEVVGVSSYYSWAGGTAPEDAAAALRAAELSRRIVAAAESRGQVAEWMPLESLRLNPSAAAQDVCARFPEGRLSCTLDFMETDEGMLLLEGGPAYTPMGGGFPCAFAGRVHPRGVALRPPEGVDLTNPATWRAAEGGSGILSWAEAEALAFGRGPEPT